MATQHSRAAARLMNAPAVFVLLVWMLIPLCMTIYFSFTDYRPLRGVFDCCVGLENYERFVSSSSFFESILTTLIMVGGILLITVIGGVLLSILVAVFAIVWYPLKRARAKRREARAQGADADS